MLSDRPNSHYARSLLDPAGAYAKPRDLVEDDRLTREQTIEILRRWEYDESERRVAEEEGMPPERADDDGDLLQQIVLALNALSDGIDLENTPPTKQGGIPRSSKT